MNDTFLVTNNNVSEDEYWRQKAEEWDYVSRQNQLDNEDNERERKQNEMLFTVGDLFEDVDYWWDEDEWDQFYGDDS